MKLIRTPSLLLAALSAGLLAAPSFSAEKSASSKPKAPAAEAPKIDAKAKEILAKMAAAYKELKSFSATIATKGGGPNVPEFTSTVQFKKPGRMTLETQAKEAKINIVSDGKNVFVQRSNDTKTYMKMDAPGEFQGVVEQVLGIGGGVGIGPTNVLLTGGDPLPPARSLKSVSVGEPGTVDGAAVETVVGDLNTPGGGKTRFIFSIGKTDHLLRKVTLELPAADGGTLTELHTNIKVNPDLPDAAFTFTPPPGATEVAPPAEPSFFHPDLKPGADPFPFTSKDMAGKDLSLDQYKGKVVLLDFWATWCGPCVAEMPNVVAAYKKYKTQGFDIVSVSLDPAKDKAKVTSFAKQHGMAWRHIFDGKGPENEVAVKYQVQAIPFALLIGRDGKIEAVNVRGEELGPAIAKALAKKG